MASVESVRKVYDSIGNQLRRYRGGMPVGFMAAIAYHESGGRMSAPGDDVLGEVGIFQITRSFPSEIGWPAESRYNQENNVFLGGLEYQLRAVEMHLAAPHIVYLGTADSWKLARLAFAIGGPGTKKLIERATGYHPAWGGNVFGAVRQLVDRGGSMSLGRQSADVVAKRVRAVDALWDIGGQVAPLFYGPPMKIRAPGGRSYSIPSKLEPYLSSNVKQFAVVGAVAAIAAVLI